MVAMSPKLFYDYQTELVSDASAVRNGRYTANSEDRGENKENGVKVYDNLDIDTAIQLTGYGRFHYKLVSACALCLLNNGLQNGLATYIFPAAQCDLQLNATEIGYLNVAFLVGGVCSSFIWGAIADLVGRRRVLLYSLFISSAFTIIGAVQSNFVALCVCRYANGFLTGAAGSITFNYVSEFHTAAHRSKSVCYVGIAYTSAWLLLPILARLILPLPSSALAGISAWRLFLAVVALPELLAGVALLCLPESPKHMAEKDREHALRILAHMYADNHRCEPDGFPVRQLSAPIAFLQQQRRTKTEPSGKVRRLAAQMCDEFRRIFQAPLVGVTLLVSLVMFCNMFGYFGLGLWLPALFQRFNHFAEQFPNETATTLKHLTGMHSLSVRNGAICTPDFEADLFHTTLAIGASALLGNFVSGWMSGSLPLRVIPFVSFFVGAISSGVLYFLYASWQHLLVACVFQGVMATANITLGGIVVELYPTKCAGIALCWTLFVGRVSGMLSNLLFGLFMDTQCEIPIFTVSAVLLVGTAFSLFIPNAGDTKLEQSNHGEPGRVLVAVITS